MLMNLRFWQRQVKTMADWIDVGSINDIPRQGARVVAGPRGNIAVFRTHDNRIFAIADRCPHKGGPLSEGIVHGHKVTCPLHNWNIDLASGEAVAPDEGCASRYDLQMERDRILVLI